MIKILFRYLSKYLNELNQIFKALNDPTRRSILELLKNKDLTAGEIADNFKMTKPSISHHLDILKRAELIEGEKKGQFVIYTLNTTIVEDIMIWLKTLQK